MDSAGSKPSASTIKRFFASPTLERVRFSNGIHQHWILPAFNLTLYVLGGRFQAFAKDLEIWQPMTVG
jgi:hypothetical protein